MNELLSGLKQMRRRRQVSEGSMRKILPLIGLAAMIAVPAQADIVTYARIGAWEAFGGSAGNGVQICGVATEGNGKWFGLKYFQGNPNAVVQMSNKNWRVPDKTQVNVLMEFDKKGPWKAQATAFHMRDGDAALEFGIPAKSVGQWLSEFRGAYVLNLTFPGSTVASWQASLIGTDRIAQEMNRCVESLLNKR